MLWEEDHEVPASLGYTGRACLKTNTVRKKEAKGSEKLLYSRREGSSRKWETLGTVPSQAGNSQDEEEQGTGLCRDTAKEGTCLFRRVCVCVCVAGCGLLSSWVQRVPPQNLMPLTCGQESSFSLRPFYPLLPSVRGLEGWKKETNPRRSKSPATSEP